MFWDRPGECGGERSPEPHSPEGPLPRGWSGRLLGGRLGADHAGLLLVLQPVALAIDVDGGGVVQQPWLLYPCLASGVPTKSPTIA